MRRKKRWIQRALRRHHKGSLRRTLTRWHLLKPGRKITASVLAKGMRRAKRNRDTHTERQINLAKTLLRVRRRK